MNLRQIVAKAEEQANQHSQGDRASFYRLFHEAVVSFSRMKGKELAGHLGIRRKRRKPVSAASK